MREVKAILGKDIFLGRSGENKATCVTFDISAWMNTYGDGTVQVIHQRNGDKTPYPCVVAQSGNRVVWEITNSDVAVAGRGRVELQYFVGDALVKSETFGTTTERALAPAIETPPPPYEAWMDTMLGLAADTIENAESAAESAEEAKQHADDAKQHADRAKENLEAALEEAKESGEFDGVGVSNIKQTVKSEEDDGDNEITFELTDGRSKTVYVQNGSRGPRGESGITTPINGFFTLAVDDNGDLWAYSEDELALDFEYDAANGNLYVVQEV